MEHAEDWTVLEDQTLDALFGSATLIGNDQGIIRGSPIEPVLDIPGVLRPSNFEQLDT